MGALGADGRACSPTASNGRFCSDNGVVGVVGDLSSVALAEEDDGVLFPRSRVDSCSDESESGVHAGR
jgi:hypothetical protein